MSEPDTGGWPKWSVWVVESLKETKKAVDDSRLETKADIASLRSEIKADLVALRDSEIADLRADINKTKQDVAMLQIKSGLWGAAGASVPIAIMLIMQYIK